MPGQIVAPIPVTPPRKSVRSGPSTDLFASLHATLASSQDSKRGTPIRSIQERDWDVPAPPPPSPKMLSHRRSFAFITISVPVMGVCLVCSFGVTDAT
ncbi:hypothetical protein GGR54DRAFT_640710 [Hypoxylon sp. NC1633]|nr:hypothetical protein GGR54DRAFT_640710 [Hypoxylon sp. NC1633]